MKYMICLSWNGFFATCVYVRVRLAIQLRFLRKVNLQVALEDPKSKTRKRRPFYFLYFTWSYYVFFFFSRKYPFLVLIFLIATEHAIKHRFYMYFLNFSQLFPSNYYAMPVRTVGELLDSCSCLFSNGLHLWVWYYNGNFPSRTSVKLKLGATGGKDIASTAEIKVKIDWLLHHWIMAWLHSW